MEDVEMITIYEHVASLTAQMLSAAKERDWEKLSSLEDSCTCEVEKIRSLDTDSPLTPELRRKKVRVIQEILSNDRQIRDITEPWMAELQQLMHSSSTSLKLNKTYAV